MAPLTFVNVYFSGDQESIVAENETNGQPGSFKISDPEASFLDIGTTFTVYDRDGKTLYSDLNYLGTTIDGEIIADDGGIIYLFTNLDYDINDQLPEIQPEEYGGGPYCFLSGVLIATPNGNRKVETIRMGDEIYAADGRTIRVKWLGWQTLGTRFGPLGHRAPIMIAAGALGQGLPARDLCLTADHALLLDGFLVHPGAIVNGTTIRRMIAAELGVSFTVYHVETEAHDLVLAEGVPAETFVDNVTRKGFDNYAEFDALYGTPAEPLHELSLPRIMSARQVPAAVKARIAEVARRVLDAVA